METVGLGFCFEDLALGRQFKTVGRTITETDVVNFINTVGMQEVLFMNIEFLKEESHIKGRVAPGALVFCMAEGLLTQATMQGTGSHSSECNSTSRGLYLSAIRFMSSVK